MSDPFDLTGRVAIVTGSVRGLGLAMAEAMARAGAIVHINGRDERRTAEAADGLAVLGLAAHPLAFDVEDEAAGIAAIEAVAGRCGRLDILVNNVGQRLRAGIDHISLDGLRSMLSVNIGGPFSLAKAAAPHMIRGGYGRIIMLSSSVASRASAGDAAYIATKGGIEALTRALACEWGRLGVTCNAIAPGPFATETNAALVADPGMRAYLEKASPIGRWGEPHEIGGACVFLASPAAAYVNGIVLPVDGGITIGS